MKLAVSFTVNDRPHYFREVLTSWKQVRGIDDVAIHFNIEPQKDLKNVSLLLSFDRGRCHFNDKQFGPGHNPYMAFKRAFDDGADYVILAEDDLVVSDDVLEYNLWAAERFKDNPWVAMVCSFSGAPEGRPHVVRHATGFASCWVWGIWRDRWEEFIEPTWDHDYSSSPSFETGWDWHLNRRILPVLMKHSVQPEVSRVKNIGDIGHFALDHYEGMESPTFQPHRPVEWWIEEGNN